jgi:hypothetical protein
MASAAQLKANSENAQHSTGPRTTEGKQQSAKNSVRHGLNATPEVLFNNNPAERDQYLALKLQLHTQTLPSGAAEELLFEQYAYSSFQSLRAQRIESEAQDRWLNQPDNQLLFVQMERAIKLGALFERRAAKAFKQLQDLQLHRLASVEVRAELEHVSTPVPFSAALPLAKLRAKQLKEEEPLYLGLTISTGLDQQTFDANPIDPTRIQPISDNKQREHENK